MCIFSRPIELVFGTRILCSSLTDARHSTVYQMAYQAQVDVAMVLPVPVRPGMGDDALSFVDLSNYEEFFDDLDRCFPPRVVLIHGKNGGYGGKRIEQPRPKLLVHSIGNYIASYVPSFDDFDRLEECFRLPAAAWETLPDYSQYGFAVFQLQPGKEKKKIHPIAYHYPPAHPGELFFPTAHLHEGGRATALADFDHSLYAQTPDSDRYRTVYDWEDSIDLPRSRMNVAKINGLLRETYRVRRLMLKGVFPNADLVLKAPDPASHNHVDYQTEARLARVPLDLGPSLRWGRFRDLALGTVNPGSSSAGRY